MLTFVFRKMINKKWMILSLLLGNILLISIACCNPLYTKAVLQRTLTRGLNDSMLATNRYPGTVTMTGSFSRRGEELLGLEKFKEVDALAPEIPEILGVPSIESVTEMHLTNVRAYPVRARGDDKERKTFEVGYLSDMDAHTELIAGRTYSEAPGEDGAYDVIVSMAMFIKHDLLLEEQYELQNLLDHDNQPIVIRIAGVFRNNNADDVYWVRQPAAYSNMIFLPENLFRELFVNLDNPQYYLQATWYQLLDYEAMRGSEAEHLLAAATALNDRVSDKNGFRYTDDFSDTVRAYQVKAKKVEVTLLVLQVPVFVLLAAFIFMVSRQMLGLEQNEIAILKSRGAGKRQILSVYCLQSVVLAVIALIIGLPLGAFLCQVLGSANAFLEFVRRSSLLVEYDATVLLYALGAALFSILVMVLPVIRYADVTIVSHKQKKNRKGGPWWQKAFLDVVLLGVSLYGLYTFNNQKDMLAARVADGASLDPLLFISSSLFIIGAGLVALRIVPLLVWLIFTIGKKLWSPALYASFLRVLRARENQGFIMVFLILTIALGIFNAQTARTINTNEEERIRYNAGADIVLQEVWADNSRTVESTDDIEYYEPDFNRYRELDGAASIARVLRMNDVQLQVSGGTVGDIRLMGVNTKEFGETAWMLDGLLKPHWYNYLNAISQNSRAVLLSSNFQNYGLSIGDVVYYRSKAGGASVRGVIYGFVDYWPGYNAVTESRDTDGLIKETENFLIVAHLNQVQASMGMYPYQVWMKAEDSSQFVYDFVDEKGITLSRFTDVSQEIVTMKNDPIFQGTNGILTVSFIVVLILCATGFLIYWVLSIQSRSLQFGIFRAMGMSLREILSMLVNEQLYISGLSIAFGALIGQLASKLYIPLIQIAYGAAEQSLPLRIVSERVDDIRLFSVIGAMMLICMVILGVLISRIKISQALKLGED